MVAAVASAFKPDALTGRQGKILQHLRRHGLLARTLKHGLGALRIGPCLIADGLEPGDTVLERRVVEIGHARLYGIVEALQAQFRFGRSLVELGDVLAAALAALLRAVEDDGENGFQPLGLQQALFQMVGDEVVELFHRHGHAFAGGGSLARPGRAGIVAIAPALAGADGHRPAAPGAVDEAGEHGRTADHAGRHNLGIAGLEQRLHRVEGLTVDDGRHRDDDDLAAGLMLPGLGPLIELVLADVGAAGEDAMDLADPPAPAVAGEYAVAVQMADDVLDAHLAGCAVAMQGEPVDQPHGVGVERVDLQLLLDLGAAFLGGDRAIADGRQRAIPEALPGVLLQGPDDVLCIFLRLILVEQGHDLPHHDVHGIVAHLLGDGDELHAVLRQLADIELQLEVVAEEAREAMDHDDVEGRGLRRAGFDHALELGAAIVGCGGAGLDKGLDELIAARQAIGLALALLVGDGDIMFGLPRRRDAQVEGGAQRHGHGRCLLVRS